MAGKKAKPEMPSNIPNLLLISGDIINPVKLLMDTAGQVVGKMSQDGSGNTKTEIKNEAKSRSSKHKIRTTKGAKEKENRYQGSKAKEHTNKHKKDKLEDFSKIDDCEYNPGYSKKKEAKKLQNESHQKERKATSTEKEQMQLPQTSRCIRRKSETPAYLPKEDKTQDLKTLEMNNMKQSTSHNRIDKLDLSDNSESYLQPQISRYQKNIRRKSEIPNLAVFHSTLHNDTSAYPLRNKITDHEDHKGYQVKSAVERDQKRRRSVPSLIFDEPGTTNYISKALNRMAIGNHIQIIIFYYVSQKNY